MGKTKFKNRLCVFLLRCNKEITKQFVLYYENKKALKSFKAFKKCKKNIIYFLLLKTTIKLHKQLQALHL